MKTGIYQIRHLASGKRYIGSAAGLRGIDGRWAAHKSLLKSREHHSVHLQRAWNKYGSDAFVFEVLLYCEAKDCLFYEQIALDCYKPEYNICNIAGNTLGRSMSKIAKLRMRKSHLGKKHSDATKNKMSVAQIGNKNCAGEKNGGSKLTAEKVVEIRLRLTNGEKPRSLARDFGVSSATISDIKFNRSWCHI
jgi:group I intron endonuclease